MGREQSELWARGGAWLGRWWRSATAPVMLIVWGGWCLWAMLLVLQELGATHCYFPEVMCVFDVDGELVVTEPGDDAWAQFESEGRPFDMVSYGTLERGGGLLFPIAASRVEQIAVSVAEADRAARVRDAAFDYLLSVGYAPDPRVRTQDVSTASIVWVGCGMNLATLFAACAFVGSARRLPELWVDKRAKLIAAGICPSCGYSIAGLPQPRCPECGERVE